MEHGETVFNFEISTGRHRHDWLMPTEEQAAMTFVRGELPNFEQVSAAYRDHAITDVIHVLS